MSHHDPTFWLLARSAGLTAYALLTLSVLAGLTLRSRPSARLRAPLVAELHKTLAVTGLAALGLHGVALVLDSTVKVTPAALVLPGLVAYRPVGVAVGVIGGWLFATIVASFWLRQRIGVKTWRRLHWLTYALFAAETYHGLASGSDAGRPWTVALYLGAVGAVAAATTWRALVPPASRRTLTKGETA
ncbi:MAG TPA: ferric reductase-like transmembrane domain-containing protein [Gaiellaceae bacterium]